jgi:hypothetical protein
LRLGRGNSAVVSVQAAALSPTTTDTAALGSTSLMWADLFLASGAIVNFNNGNYTLTHSAGLLAFSGNISVPNAIGVLDDSGNEQLLFNKTGSAVNQWEMTNAATAGKPNLKVAGGDTNIIGRIDGKGTGGIEIKGTSTNDAASTGYVGEFLSVSVSFAGRTSASVDTDTVVMSLELTAGDWLVAAQCGVAMSSFTSITHMHACLTTGSILTTAPGTYNETIAMHIGANHGNGWLYSLRPCRISLSATTTINMVAQNTYSGSGFGNYGSIGAWRIR